MSAVGEALAELDEMTQQNPALVEQSAASLSEQPRRLAVVVSAFKVN